MITLATDTSGARGGTLGSITPIAAVVASAVGALTLGSGAAAVAVVLIGGVAAVADLRTGRIPDRLVALAALAVAAASIVAVGIGSVASLGGCLLGSLACAGPLLACHVVAPDSIGFGDVKLAAVAGAALGLTDPRNGLLALCVAVGVTALVGIVGRRSVLPLGPGLVIGTAVAAVATGLVWA